MFHSKEALTSVSPFAATTGLRFAVDMVSLCFSNLIALFPDLWICLLGVGTALGEALGGAITGDAVVCKQWQHGLRTCGC